MKPNWTLRQLLALMRGLALMIALFWGLILLQLVPSLIRRGIAGVHEHIARAAVAGLPPEQWGIAITRMYLGLGATLAFGVFLYLAQRYLGRKLASQSHSAART